VQPDGRSVPILIERIEYFTAADIQRDLGVARQTLWRWRKGGKIPQGRRYRDRQIVFTRQEVDAIRDYSNRLEPVESTGHDQLALFGLPSPKNTV
jgi:predicted DNA-binding transcriptional regulator AlpA